MITLCELIILFLFVEDKKKMLWQYVFNQPEIFF